MSSVRSLQVLKCVTENIFANYEINTLAKIFYLILFLEEVRLHKFGFNFAANSSDVATSRTL